ncbi:fatty-acyl-CoA synthase [Anaerobacterium chartisolvens]|uniref:Fatty-acyl-CoA synthase n=1 Tax=Anaerobacterium chartisolvens TaxID=1297424 RepID=A0A369B6Z9_9FIRM|nr:class I adenylate-forming enzyme family protein [Anaerobacterium chartisolvens]RCX16307.1 fatty-acyl-CoA synthase [Anaerobacterium chartisolvens]
MFKGRKTIGNVINSYTEKFQDKTVLMFDDSHYSFKDLQKTAIIIAYNLSKLGIKKGDRVAIVMNNRVEYIFCYYALALLGAWVIPVNIRYEAGELKNVLSNAEASTVIYERQIDNFDFYRVIDEIKHELPNLRNLIVCQMEEQVEDKTLFLDVLRLKDDENYHDAFNKVMELEAQVEEDATFLLAYTSGTTGNPKGVMLQHDYFVTICHNLNEIWSGERKKEEGGQSHGITMSVAPLYAAQGFMALFIELLTGETIQMCSSFIPNEIIRYLNNKNVIAFHTQPTFWSLLLTVPYFHHLDLTHLQRCVVSGSLCSPTLAAKIAELTKGIIINAYGLVEATCISTITRLEDLPDITFNTIGKPVDGIEYKIVDSERKEVPKGEVGELALRGFNMKGYYRNPEKTKEVIDDEGWLYTGDLVRMYDEENISIVGRSKDMVVRGAFNVYPSDIEECLYGFDKIHDVAVVGKPNEILGESLVAFVVPKPGAVLKEGDIMRFCRGKISNYKIPDDVVFISQMPILESGKVKKNVLREWALSGTPDNQRLFFNNRARANFGKGE